MAKFKVGDRVKTIGNRCSNANIPDGTIICRYSNKPVCWIVQDNTQTLTHQTEGIGISNYVDENDLELIQPTYTKIEPKVGQRYRVLKTLINFQGKSCDEIEVGSIKEVVYKSNKARYIGIDGGRCILSENFTTEYLELVEEEKLDNLCISTGNSKSLQHGDIIYKTDDSFVKERPEEFKQPITTKIMNRIKKALLSKDDKTLIEARYLDESLSLTYEGKEALQFIQFEANKKALVEMAQADLDEQKKD